MGEGGEAWGRGMDKSTTFICNSQSKKPLSEGLSHQMEECNWNGGWSRVVQCFFLNFSLKSLLQYVYHFYLFMKCMYSSFHNNNK